MNLCVFRVNGHLRLDSEKPIYGYDFHHPLCPRSQFLHIFMAFVAPDLLLCSVFIGLVLMGQGGRLTSVVITQAILLLVPGSPRS